MKWGKKCTPPAPDKVYRSNTSEETIAGSPPQSAQHAFP